MADSKAIIVKIREKFPDAILDVGEGAGSATISIKRGFVRKVLQFIRDDPELGCNFLADLFGIDYMEMGGHERFAVIYNLYSFQHAHRIYIKAFVPEDDPRIDSVVSLWTGANWAERETYDMYGISFNDHPNMTRILCPDDFTGHPLRKDFPLTGIGYRESFPKIERSTK